MTSAPILTKRQNYQLWRAGAFGNKLRSWTVESWERYFDNRPVCEINDLIKVAVRTLRSGNGPCFYNLHAFEVWSAIAALSTRGYLEHEVTIDEMAPSERTILQGEYLNAIREIDSEVHNGIFFCSRYPAPMRAALAQRNCRETVSGLRADLMIRGAMNTASYEDWRDLLDLYPDHVLEVSIFDHCLGDIPNRNALVWEVRRY